ncbi:MAG: hypothetical protein AVO33_00850 [delta proteobacterium ML8_F1]|nr:MAG: hypothetical protein AVO33_00850 [delta proteobacterium ML8_F1]
MVRLLAGKKGTGKTKQIIDLANDQVEKSPGHIVFIDDDMRHSYEINHDIRLLNMEEFSIKTADEFFGFLCGIASTDYDIETIYVDGILKIIDLQYSDLPDYLEKIEKMCESYDVEFVISFTADPEELPGSLKEKLI